MMELHSTPATLVFTNIKLLPMRHGQIILSIVLHMRINRLWRMVEMPIRLPTNTIGFSWAVILMAKLLATGMVFPYRSARTAQLLPSDLLTMMQPVIMPAMRVSINIKRLRMRLGLIIPSIVLRMRINRLSLMVVMRIRFPANPIGFSWAVIWMAKRPMTNLLFSFRSARMARLLPLVVKRMMELLEMLVTIVVMLAFINMIRLKLQV